MVRLASFVALYFPVFLLGAVFGKMIEISGFARSITGSLVRIVGPGKSVFSVVAVCALLTYGGVSLFVVAFSIYPFAAELFREAAIPKRLIPASIALGAFTFTMDALPGSPQIQNIIPTTFFHTDAWAAPRLGLLGGAYVFLAGMAYLEFRRRRARRAGEGYGEGHRNEPAPPGEERLPHPAVAMMPLVLVPLLNKLLTSWIGRAYGHTFEFGSFGMAKVVPVDVDAVRATWAVEGALLAAILLVVFLSLGRIRSSFNSAAGAAVSGALLAALNTGSEYGFGAVIALLPGFKVVNEFLSQAIHNTLAQRGRKNQHPGGDYRIGFRRNEHRAGLDGRDVFGSGAGRRHTRRGPAPRDGHGQRRHGHAAAQRRDHHAAGDHRPDAPPVLQRHLRHDPHQNLGSRGGDRALLSIQDQLRRRACFDWTAKWH